MKLSLTLAGLSLALVLGATELAQAQHAMPPMNRPSRNNDQADGGKNAPGMEPAPQSRPQQPPMPGPQMRGRGMGGGPMGMHPRGGGNPHHLQSPPWMQQGQPQAPAGRTGGWDRGNQCPQWGPCPGGPGGWGRHGGGAPQFQGQAPPMQRGFQNAPRGNAPFQGMNPQSRPDMNPRMMPQMNPPMQPGMNPWRQQGRMGQQWQRGPQGRAWGGPSQFTPPGRQGFSAGPWQGGPQHQPPFGPQQRQPGFAPQQDGWRGMAGPQGPGPGFQPQRGPEGSRDQRPDPQIISQRIEQLQRELNELRERQNQMMPQQNQRGGRGR